MNDLFTALNPQIIRLWFKQQSSETRALLLRQLIDEDAYFSFPGEAEPGDELRVALIRAKQEKEKLEKELAEYKKETMKAQAPYITKGTKVQAQWLVPNNPPSSLAGMQMKVGAKEVHVIGTCVHFRGDDLNPKEVRIYIDVTEGTLPSEVKKVVPHGCTHQGGHVEIREEWIIGIEQDGKTYVVKK